MVSKTSEYFPLCFVTLLLPSLFLVMPFFWCQSLNILSSGNCVVVLLKGPLQIISQFYVLLLPFFSWGVYLEFSPNLICFFELVLGFPFCFHCQWLLSRSPSCQACGAAVASYVRLCIQCIYWGLNMYHFLSRSRLVFRKLVLSCYLTAQGSVIALCYSLQQVPALLPELLILILNALILFN